MEQYRTVHSRVDGLPLEVLEILPEGDVCGIFQIVHGMQEHKERYLNFMRYMARHGFACIAHDHRGHGKSVHKPQDLGYFYEEDAQAICDDVETAALDLQSRYPHAKRVLLGHSMGSLIARKYLKKYDDRIQGLVLSGAVYENPGAKSGKIILRALGRIRGDHQTSKLITALVDGSFDRKIDGDKKNRWLSYNEENVESFNEDPLSGFPYTINAYKNLLQLVIDVYDDSGWQLKNAKLPVFFCAGQQDPVIGGFDHFVQTVQDLKKKGYSNIIYTLYPHMRHEILNEVGREKVYEDILNFAKECCK